MTTRRTTMRRFLGPVTVTLLVGLVAGCGHQTSSTTHAGAPPQSPSAGPVAGATVLPLISLTGGGGRPATAATLLGTPQQVRGFTSQLRLPLANQVAAAAQRAQRSGYLVYGAVLTVGCDRPPGASVALDAQGDVQITPGEVASPLPECLAPVTTVAIATVPGAQ